MKNRIRAICLALGLTIGAGVLEAVTPAPASADSTCHIASPQINNSIVCAQLSLSYNGYYNVLGSHQVKSANWTTQVQVQVYDGTWYAASAWLSYQPFSSGVKTVGFGPLAERPRRARIVAVNTITGQTVTYGWQPWPSV